MEETKKLHFDHTINKIDDDSVNNEMIFFVKKDNVCIEQQSIHEKRDKG